MEELAKKLKDELKFYNVCTVEPGIDDVFVYCDHDVASPYLAMSIFAFAKLHSLKCFIGISTQGHLRFVLYED